MSTQIAKGRGGGANPDGLINIEVIYPRPESVWRQELQLSPSGTVQQALAASGFFDDFPEWTAATVKVGIYGRQCALDRVLHNNERIEIYRPLVFDPMESRRRRALHRQRTKQSGKMSRT